MAAKKKSKMPSKKKSRMPPKKRGGKKMHKAMMMMGDPGTLPPPGGDGS
jgi:hypothetical protein